MLEKPGKQERAVDLIAVQVDQVASGIRHCESVMRNVGGAGPELRGDIAVPEQRLEAAVAARLIRQQVGDGGRARACLPELDCLRARAELAVRSAVHADAHVVGSLGVLEAVGVGGQLGDLRRVRPEHLGQVDSGVLEFLVGSGDLTHSAAGPGVRHPWRRGHGGRRRRVLGCGRRLGRVHHPRVRVVAGSRRAGRVEDRVRPVGERASLVRCPVRVEGSVAIGDRHALAVAIQPGKGRQDVIGSMRDKRRVVVRHPRAVVLEELQQARHQLQVRRDVRVVPEEMDVVENELDDVLDAIAELARAGRIGSGCGGARRSGSGGESHPRRCRTG